ncbi:MAG: hypothetical protein U0Q12_11955 [Vicinamibacterales bacterium]
MAFTLIKGGFHVLSQTKTGKPTGFQPDGDSVQFKPDRPSLLDQLKRVQSPYRLSAIGSTQLRFEGIDALELHFQAKGAGITHQPRPLADRARDHLLDAGGLEPVTFTAPDFIRVQPPAPHDGALGYILSRSLDVHGRPVAFAFAGEPPEPDGTVVHLTTARVARSLNHEMLAAGQAYPLFYDTLFADLRAVFAKASADAHAARRGLWREDRTRKGVDAPSVDVLESDGVIFPKLFRRLVEFYGEGGGALADFPAWVSATGERVFDLDTTNNTHFGTYVSVARGRVKLTKSPDRLVFVSAKGLAAWL